MRFVDTNVLLYAVSRASAEHSKAEIARTLLDHGDLALSVQVLQEFYVQATREAKLDKLTHRQAILFIEAFTRFPVLELTIPLMEAALHAKEQYRLSYWDAAILESARMMGCRTLLSEDLSDGRDYQGVRVVNPFRNT